MHDCIIKDLSRISCGYACNCNNMTGNDARIQRNTNDMTISTIVMYKTGGACQIKVRQTMREFSNVIHKLSFCTLHHTGSKTAKHHNQSS